MNTPGTTIVSVGSSERYRRTERSAVGIADSPWHTLYNIGGAAALLVVLFIPIQMTVFFVWPPPADASGWFALFQKEPLVGLLDMDLLLIVDSALFIPIFLGLYVALRRSGESLMAIATVAGLLGIGAYFASTVAFEMLSLSNHYSAATSDAQRSIFLTAGESMLATWQGTAFDVGYILQAIALLIISSVMLRSTIFTRATAYTGIVMGILMLVPPSVGTVGIILSLLSLLPLVVWLIMISRTFFRLR
jgi:hypothetical protein